MDTDFFYFCDCKTILLICVPIYVILCVSQIFYTVCAIIFITVMEISFKLFFEFLPFCMFCDIGVLFFDLLADQILAADFGLSNIGLAEQVSLGILTKKKKNYSENVTFAKNPFCII